MVLLLILMLVQNNNIYVGDNVNINIDVRIFRQYILPVWVLQTIIRH